MSTGIRRWVAALGAVTVFVGGCGLYGANKQPAPAKQSANSNRNTVIKGAALKKAPGRPLRVIAFYDQTMSAVSPDPFTLVKAHPGLVDYIAPFWYEVTGTGGIIAKPQGNAATLARQDRLALLPLFNNYGGTDKMLTSATARSQAVKNIAALVKKNNYAGVNIDFQLLKSYDRPYLTKFVDALYRAMPKGKLLSMSVVPLTNANGQASAYDYAALNKMLSAVVLMAYDLHGDGTSPGPVSPYPWVSKAISRAIHAGIARDKLYLGIADYGYLWTNGSTKATTIPLKVMHQHLYGTYTWNPVYKEAYDKYTSNGATHVIWFVNDRAAAARIRLAKRYHLAGVAFWRLGYEDAKWWNTVAKALRAPEHPGTSPQHQKRSS